MCSNHAASSFSAYIRVCVFVRVCYIRVYTYTVHSSVVVIMPVKRRQKLLACSSSLSQETTTSLALCGLRLVLMSILFGLDCSCNIVLFLMIDC